MADQIELLKQLQDLDGELFRLRKQQLEKPQELERVQADVAAQEQQLKNIEQRLRTLQVSQKEKDMELQTRDANIKKLQGQLFQVKTNKEYTAMQHEIDSLKADNSVLEEAILNILEEIDQAATQRHGEQAKLAQQQQRLQAERARLDRELAEIMQHIAELDRHRKLLLPDVPPLTLATYERILPLREGLALVPVLNDACGGCHRRLPPQVINEVYLKAKLVTCEHCSRILYFDEAQSKL